MQRFLSSLLGFLVLWMASAGAVVPAHGAEGDAVVIPWVIDPRRKLEPPEPGQVRQIRFVTEDDYPPFHFVGPDGQLMGFEIDLARAVCVELKATCSIQPRRWDTLKEALAGGQADAIIAALRVTADARRDFAFSLPYFRNPARFVTRRSAPFEDASAQTLAGRMIAVAENSAHAAFISAYLPGARLRNEPSPAAALESINAGKADVAFVDGVSAAFWLNGTTSQECCRFLGGAYLDTHWFGEGAGIAVSRNNRRLVQAIDWALQRLMVEGTYARLYLKYFPVGIY